MFCIREMRDTGQSFILIGCLHEGGWSHTCAMYELVLLLYQFNHHSILGNDKLLKRVPPFSSLTEK